MPTSRDTILNKLRAARNSVAPYDSVHDHLPMVPLDGDTPEILVPRFIEQSQRLGAVVHSATTPADAVEAMLELIGSDLCVLCWSFEDVALPGLADAFTMRGISVAEPRDAFMRIGITGADGALAATGSLVMTAAPGKDRTTSLLPPIHIAVVRTSQVIRDLETWVAAQRAQGLDAFRACSSVILISGPSRTADIAMQLTLGMHGPGELHIILLAD
jgi:L-lactate dehydrogenase complex protein LldG